MIPGKFRLSIGNGTLIPYESKKYSTVFETSEMKFDTNERELGFFWVTDKALVA